MRERERGKGKQSRERGEEGRQGGNKNSHIMINRRFGPRLMRLLIAGDGDGVRKGGEGGSDCGNGGGDRVTDGDEQTRITRI